MCIECGFYICPPGCPNAPTPIPVETCHICGEGILDGDKYFNGLGGPVCVNCVEDMTPSEIIKLCGESFSVAQGGF